MTDKTPKQIGIRRIDNPLTHTHSWHVLIQRRKQIITRHFSDGMYGGKEESYQAALAFWHEIDNTQPKLQRKEYADILRKNNTSGVPGVSKHKFNGREYWNARWPTAVGQYKSAKFSIAKYGHEKAFELALKARKQGLENLTEPYNTKHASHPSVDESSDSPLKQASQYVLAHTSLHTHLPSSGKVKQLASLSHAGL